MAIPFIFPALPVSAKTTTSLKFSFQRRIGAFGSTYRMAVIYETILELSEMYETPRQITRTLVKDEKEIS